MTAQEKYTLWRDQVPAGTPIAQELADLSGNYREIQARFGADLTFGTAGLRGIMGAGTDRMNIYTVRRAALAYGQYIKNADLPDTCAIAYDTRNNSRLFSETCAAALAEVGIHVYLYPNAAPTPMLSFAVRALACQAGGISRQRSPRRNAVRRIAVFFSSSSMSSAFRRIWATVLL